MKMYPLAACTDIVHWLIRNFYFNEKMIVFMIPIIFRLLEIKNETETKKK